MLSNNLCHNITGCKSPIRVNNSTVCAVCDQLNNFELKNNKCVCKQGYKLNSKTKTC